MRLVKLIGGPLDRAKTPDDRPDADKVCFPICYGSGIRGAFYVRNGDRDLVFEKMEPRCLPQPY